MSKAVVGYERIQEVLDIESRGARHAGRAPGAEVQGTDRLRARDLQLRHDKRRPEGRQLQDRAGQVAAIVGPSGTGKTTLVSLIPRFYDPVVRSRDHRRHGRPQVQLKSLRDQISFVLQDTLLFRATIWENIAYGKPDASPAEIKRAADLANAHEFIEEMPEGYDTMVGERGVTLSGGQRQRIAIARAIIRDTPILILDEPTVGLDAASEQAVIGALDTLMKGRTSVVIAHHLGSIRHADVIFVFNDADLVEQGTHDELLAKDGVYAELYKMQTARGGIVKLIVQPEAGVAPLLAAIKTAKKPSRLPSSGSIARTSRWR